ncbi:Ycx1p RNJ42_01362 [Nakaseomyces bracarensis]|uniref:Ycx1p n=1 Tax=Nakaseomyces bracarensis TaxID=273131 RepID=UPI0038725047
MGLVRRWLFTALFYFINLIAVVRYLDNDDRSRGGFYSKMVLLTECFVMLGVLTSDYLTPSLSFISREILHISDRISGMTLLAFGNALPDITTTYQSMKRNATSLAFGELMGGVFFLLTVVLGVIGLVSTVRFEPTSPFGHYAERFDSYNENIRSNAYSRDVYLQDLGIFLVMIVVSTSFLFDGRLYFWECLLMVITYICCAIYMVSSHLSYCSTSEANSEIVEESSLRELINDNLSTCSDGNDSLIRSPTTIEPILSENANIRMFEEGVDVRRKYLRLGVQKYLRTHYKGWVRLTLQDCLDLWEHSEIINKEGNSKTEEVTTMQEQGESSQDEAIDVVPELPKLDRIQTNKRTKRRSSTLGTASERDALPTFVYSDYTGQGGKNTLEVVDATKQFSRPQPNSIAAFEGRPPTWRSLSYDHLGDIIQQESPTPSYGSIEVDDDEINEELQEIISRVSGTSRNMTWYKSFKLFNYLLDPDIDMSPTELVTLLFSTPISFILAVLIPSEETRQMYNNNNVVTTIQLSMAPIVLSFTLDNLFGYYVLVTISFMLILIFSLFETPLRLYRPDIISVFGFILSLGGISYTVHLILDILTSWADSFNLSQTVLGLTIFAWGNSVGDLVSNITFVQLGVLDVALGACFGSPLLYILFGIGMDGAIILLNKHAFKERNGLGALLTSFIEFKVDAHLISTCVGIILAFLILIVGVPLNHWRLDSRISTWLLSLYAFVTVINIILALSF